MTTTPHKPHIPSTGATPVTATNTNPQNHNTAMSRTGHRTYRRKRQAVLAGQDLTCAWCGKPIDKNLKFPHPMSPSADHITPVASGGHNLGPLQPMHLSCNSSKGKRGDNHRPHTNHNRNW